MAEYNIILTKETIRNRVKELGETISNDYNGKNLLVICMLKGAVHFFSDLIRHISTPMLVDFARVSSYKSGKTSGQIEKISDITIDVYQKDVLIIEDIVDSGNTLRYYIDKIKKSSPKTIKICTLINKPSKHKGCVKIDYVGFNLDCGYLIGYGLDFAERYRELPFVAQLTSE